MWEQSGREERNLIVFEDVELGPVAEQSPASRTFRDTLDSAWKKQLVKVSSLQTPYRCRTAADHIGSRSKEHDFHHR